MGLSGEGESGVSFVSLLGYLLALGVSCDCGRESSLGIMGCDVMVGVSIIIVGHVM